MRKSRIAAIALAMLLIGVPVFAQVSFFINAQLPAASSATFTVSKVLVGPPLVFQVQPPGSVNLNFGTLAFNAVNGIFVTSPAHFWVIDVGSNGAGMPDILANYVDTGKPAAQVAGLGARATFNHAEITGPTGSQVTNDLGTRALASVTNLSIPETDFSDGFLRVSVGLATGLPIIAGATPFTALDQPGAYTGTLTLTATFD